MKTDISIVIAQCTMYIEISTLKSSIKPYWMAPRMAHVCEFFVHMYILSCDKLYNNKLYL